MQDRSKPTDVMTTRLMDLERLLMDEAEALKKLDRESIERLSLEKLAVAEALGALGKPDKEHEALLERIKRRALMNQLLLVNARDCLRGVIELATGGVVKAGYGSDRPSGRARLDITG
jgi:hypothetical protein